MATWSCTRTPQARTSQRPSPGRWRGSSARRWTSCCRQPTDALTAITPWFAISRVFLFAACRVLRVLVVAPPAPQWRGRSSPPVGRCYLCDSCESWDRCGVP
ncbi:hypothetical protein ACFPRL_11415 [Pseudoclavibacter helvolus]